jgi:hypothetical protein
MMICLTQIIVTTGAEFLVCDGIFFIKTPQLLTSSGSGALNSAQLSDEIKAWARFLTI